MSVMSFSYGRSTILLHYSRSLGVQGDTAAPTAATSVTVAPPASASAAFASAVTSSQPQQAPNQVAGKFWQPQKEIRGLRYCDCGKRHGVLLAGFLLLSLSPSLCLRVLSFSLFVSPLASLSSSFKFTLSMPSVFFFFSFFPLLQARFTELQPGLSCLLSVIVLASSFHSDCWHTSGFVSS